jgi:hypothetical protein
VVISIVFGNYLGKSVVMDIQAISGCRYSGCMRGNKVGPSTATYNEIQITASM